MSLLHFGAECPCSVRVGINCPILLSHFFMLWDTLSSLLTLSFSTTPLKKKALSHVLNAYGWDSGTKRLSVSDCHPWTNL
jgi:hypothetical protein